GDVNPVSQTQAFEYCCLPTASGASQDQIVAAFDIREPKKEVGVKRPQDAMSLANLLATEIVERGQQLGHILALGLLKFRVNFGKAHEELSRASRQMIHSDVPLHKVPGKEMI